MYTAVGKTDSKEMEGDAVLIFKPRRNKVLKPQNVYEIARREVIRGLLQK